MEPAGHLVTVTAELAAGVEHREHDLGGTLALVATRRVRIDRDATTVVFDPATAIGEQGDDDAVGEAGHRLVDGVVDDLPDEVMEAGQAGRADVHARALAHRVEALEDLDVLGAVVGRPAVRAGFSVARHTAVGVVVARHWCALSSRHWRVFVRCVGPGEQGLGTERRSRHPRGPSISGSSLVMSQFCGPRPASENPLGGVSAMSFSLPAGCHREVDLALLHRRFGRPPATRTSTVSIVVPATSRTRVRRVSESLRICVAQAGSVTSTTNRAPSRRTGWTCGRNVLADDLTPAPEHSPHRLRLAARASFTALHRTHHAVDRILQRQWVVVVRPRHDVPPVCEHRPRFMGR